MSDELGQKGEIFGRIWQLYKNIEATLKKIGIPDTRLPDYNKCTELILETHINKLRHGEEWLKAFINTHIKAWEKVRGENPEDYWDKIQILGMGSEFTEVKRLNELSKKVKSDWFTPHNFLAPAKRVKKDKEDATTQTQ